MKRFRNTAFYIIVMSIFTALIFWLITMGKKLEVGRGVIERNSSNNPFIDFLESIKENLHHSVALLILQIIVIIVIARFFSWIFKKIGQPSVIGEILAGIVLGPSLLGLYFPEISNMLFPDESLSNLNILSQIGLILFMYVIGMELNVKALQSKVHDAVIISHASIIIPFAMGIGLAYFIYQDHSPEDINFISFSLFIGIALSITAFPVLARIIQEQGIHKTRLGSIVITCAASDDITAWCLLAVVIAIVKAGSVFSALYTILFALIYVVIMIKLIRPFLAHIGKIYQSEKLLNQSVVAIFFIVLLASAFVTETIGIHALFGAFMAGAIMPDSEKFRSVFISKLEDVALILLLPLFFVISGLRTEIGLINDPKLWEVTGLIIIFAIIGKFLGSAIAARYVGQTWKDSLTIGALMNTRGLMELVALNIGYELGVLNAEVFAMMVIMALVTTFMTGPILKLINFIYRKQTKETTEGETKKYKFLLFFRNPKRGAALFKLADNLLHKNNEEVSITAVHMIPPKGLHQLDTQQYEEDCFEPIAEEATALNRDFVSLFKVSGAISDDLVDIANKGEYNLLLMNMEDSIFRGSVLGRALGFTTRIINPGRLLNIVIGKEKLLESSFIDDNTRVVLSKTKMPVGILIDNGFNIPKRIFLPILNESDKFLMNYVENLAYNVGARINLVKAPNIDVDQSSPTLSKLVHIVNMESINQDFLEQQDLIIISLKNFEKIIIEHKNWISKSKSILIIKE